MVIEVYSVTDSNISKISSIPTYLNELSLDTEYSFANFSDWERSSTFLIEHPDKNTIATNNVNTNFFIIYFSYPKN